MSATANLNVPFVALDRQHEALAEELDAAFHRVLGASSFILGSELEAFEQEFAAYCGVQHCVGVASGTAALTLSLLAAGVGQGDEVIVPAHTYIATALGVVHAGATPVFCDVVQETGLIDPAALAAAIGPRTAAILPVHLYGQPADMEAIAEVGQQHGLAVIEDAAQAHGAFVGERRAGSIGRAGAFSFYPSKNLGALGDGGAICTDDDELAERARQLRHLGQRSKGEHVVAGYNERLDGLQAALLRVKLGHLDRWNQRRRELAAVYRKALGQDVAVLGERPGAQCVYHLFPVRVADRDGLAAQLQSEGIQTGIHYHPSVPEQPPFREGQGAGDFPVAAAWAREELSLPMYPELEEPEVLRVAEVCGR